MVKLIAALLLTAGAAAAETVEEARQRYLQGEYVGVFEVIVPAAEAGDPVAQNLLGNAHYYGFGQAQDCDKALEWTLKAAEQGLGRALFNLARYYDVGCIGQGAQPALAAPAYLRAIEAGIDTATIFLAELMASGRIGPPDPAAIERRLTDAIAAGTEGADVALARMLVAGTVLPKDHDRAFTLLHPLSIKGVPDALHQLALMYEAGFPRGVPDIAAAHALMNEALELGSTFVIADLARLLTLSEGSGFHDPVRGFALCYWGNTRLIGHPEFAGHFAAPCDALSPYTTPEQKAAGRRMAESWQ